MEVHFPFTFLLRMAMDRWATGVPLVARVTQEARLSSGMDHDAFEITGPSVPFADIRKEISSGIGSQTSTDMVLFSGNSAKSLLKKDGKAALVIYNGIQIQLVKVFCLDRSFSMIPALLNGELLRLKNLKFFIPPETDALRSTLLSQGAAVTVDRSLRGKIRVSASRGKNLTTHFYPLRDLRTLAGK